MVKTQQVIFLNSFKHIIINNLHILSGVLSNWKARAKKWGKDFVKFFTKDSARIYIHILVYHAYDLYQRHQEYLGLEMLSQQGFEAANHRDIYQMMHHTSRFGGKVSYLLYLYYLFFLNYFCISCYTFS